MARMHSLGPAGLLIVATIAFSGCVAPKLDLNTLEGPDSDFDADAFAQNAAGTAAADPVEAPEPPATPVLESGASETDAEDPPETSEATDASSEEVDEPAPGSAPEEGADDTASSSDEEEERDEDARPRGRGNDTDGEAPAPTEQPPTNQECERSIVVDHDKKIIWPKSNAGTAYNNQAVSGWYRILDDRVVESGIAVGLADADDFCRIEDAYPCMWSDSFPRTDYDRYAEKDGWMVHFGFTNVIGGHNDGSGDPDKRAYTDYHVRAWARLADGTLILDNDPDIALWGHIRSKEGAAAHSDHEEGTVLCDVQAKGLIPSSA